MSLRPTPGRGALGRAARELTGYALGFPEATEDHPWGHVAVKVRGKAFLFLGLDDEHLSLSCKLPSSRLEALLLPFAAPTGYGLGKHGWVTATFAPGATPPVPVLAGWIEESFRAIAPKTLVRALDGGGEAAVERGSATEPRAKKGAAKKAATKAAGKKAAARKAAAKKAAVTKTVGERAASRSAAAKARATRTGQTTRHKRGTR